MQGNTWRTELHWNVLEHIPVHSSTPMHSAARCRAIAGSYPNPDFHSHASPCIPHASLCIGRSILVMWIKCSEWLGANCVLNFSGAHATFVKKIVYFCYCPPGILAIKIIYWFRNKSKSCFSFVQEGIKWFIYIDRKCGPRILTYTRRKG